MTDPKPSTAPDPGDEPIGTPPGGGRWTWSPTERAWVPLADNETPAEE